MRDFTLVSAEPSRHGFTELVMKARLSFEEFIALGDLEQDPYSSESLLDLWVDSPAPLCATRLDGPSKPDILVTHEAFLYEVRAFTRIASPTEAAVRDLLENELAGVLAARASQR